MNRPPSTAVARVRKSAAPRAVMKPDELPPTPRPPPSDRCIKMTAMSVTAMSVWTISRKANMSSFQKECATRLNRRRASFQPRLLAGRCRSGTANERVELLGGVTDRHGSVGVAAKPGARQRNPLPGSQRNGHLAVVDGLDLADSRAGRAVHRRSGDNRLLRGSSALLDLRIELDLGHAEQQLAVIQREAGLWQ